MAPRPLQIIAGVYVTAFCLFLYLTGIHFRGELQHGGDVSQWAKSQVSTNQNSRNRWCLIVRHTIWILESTQTLTSASRGKFWTADWKAVTANLKPSPNMTCCGCWWLGWWCLTNFSYDSPMAPPWFPHVSPMIPLLFLWVPGWFPVGSPRFPFQILRYLDLVVINS